MGPSVVYLVLDGDGHLVSTHLVHDYAGQTGVKQLAENIGGAVAMLPVVNDYRRKPDA